MNNLDQLKEMTNKMHDNILNHRDSLFGFSALESIMFINLIEELIKREGK
jgi:hypothetical protein